jgi:hypothetical protein
MRHPQKPSLHVTIRGPDRGQAFGRRRTDMSPMLPVVGVLGARRGRKGRRREQYADYQRDLAHLLDLIHRPYKPRQGRDIILQSGISQINLRCEGKFRDLS